ncbi:CDP-diacylglycerol--serine O-phosphatidyltransferase [Methanosphaera cuniculi]|uniref:CDP-diacylglycerol--serine O-phosphatidyltransferase n=1 Tax=Methanosphaera cuniculi TaxID=1077256 RepID=UPI0026DCA6BD|nr:CDP-diacylglycerol--serine O-phosphatidyltransferase [Methanosphaera cuniculi]
METNILKMITIADIASIANAICGLLAIFLILNGNNIASAQLLLLAVVFDCIDGTLARKFNTHSIGSFGETIDSLADMISFGVAPAIILYMISNSYWIIIPSIIIVVCGLLRLTRYNTIIEYQDEPTKTFLGLPIPVTSTLLAALILAGITNIYILIILLMIVSILMVSEVKYPKVKNKKIIAIAAIVIILCIIPHINGILYLVPSYLLIIGVLIYIFAILFGNFEATQLNEKRQPTTRQKRPSLYKDE